MKQRIFQAYLAIAKDRSLQILLAAVVLAVIVNVIFAFTYPINIGQSDNPTFLRMIAFGTSDLMHASGYAATLHFLTHRILPPFSTSVTATGLTMKFPDSWYRTLQGTQVLLHLSLFAGSIFLCAKVFGNATAAIVALGWGCNLLFISNVNATAPEWLEAHALLLSLLMHAYARKLAAKQKVLMYSLAAGVFGIAYLIKPNSLLFAVVPLALILFDRKTWRFKAIQLSVSAVIVLSVVSWYASSYHHDSTGTTQLNFDHAWVLTAALPSDYVSVSPERLGDDSLRWAVLSRVTPPEYFRAGTVPHISFGPPAEEQQRYQQQLAAVSDMSREELIKFVGANPLPPGFNQWLSAVPLYYYYGLEYVDALGIQVYMESLRSHWRYHLQKAGVALAAFFGQGLRSIQTFPTLANPVGLEFLAPDVNAGIFGESKFVLPPDANPLFVEYFNPRQSVSYFGLKIVGALTRLSPPYFVYLALNILCLVGLFTLRSDVEKVSAFSLLASLLIFISASGILLGVRQKELITVTPVYFLFLSIGLASAGRWIVRKSSPAEVLEPRRRPNASLRRRRS